MGPRLGISAVQYNQNPSLFVSCHSSIISLTPASVTNLTT